MKKIYHFLGGVYFAIILIFLTAIYTAVGTFIESKTSSHLQAAYFTYENPFFRSLLVLFFVNILIASLRRYPFKPRHIPFLMTHLGLLMIISGCIVKSLLGYQGAMVLKEGSGSDTIILPNTHAIKIENKQKSFITPLPFFGNKIKTPFKDLLISITNFEPHSEEALMVFENEKIITQQDPYEFAHNYFIANASIIKENMSYPLSKVLTKSSFTKEEQTFNIYIDKYYEIQSFGNQNICVSMKPSKLILESSDKKIYCFFFNKNGFIFHYIFENLPEIYILDNGYGGYFSQISLPKNFDTWSIEYLKEKEQHLIQKELEYLFSDVDKLPKPMQIFYNSSINNTIEPSIYLKNYLVEWKQKGTFLFNKDDWLIKSLDFSTLSSSDLSGLFWTASFFEKLDHEQIDLKDVDLDFVQETLLRNKTSDEQELEIANKLFMLGKQHENLLIGAKKDNESLFCAFLKINGFNKKFNYNEFCQQSLENEDLFYSYSKVTNSITSKASEQKWEENKPMIELELRDGEKKENIKLSYQIHNKGLKWPIFNGKYLISFEPLTKKIPNKFRLREAKKILFPNSSDVFCYESDVLIDDKEETISMNQIVETKEGCRFYMSSFQENGMMNAKVAIFTVNRDPAKKILTYPGAFFLSLGIILLFWVKNKNKKRFHDTDL